MILNLFILCLSPSSPILWVMTAIRTLCCRMSLCCSKNLGPIRLWCGITSPIVSGELVGGRISFMCFLKIENIQMHVVFLRRNDKYLTIIQPYNFIKMNIKFLMWYVKVYNTWSFGIILKKKCVYCDACLFLVHQNLRHAFDAHVLFQNGKKLRLNFLPCCNLSHFLYY